MRREEQKTQSRIRSVLSNLLKSGGILLLTTLISFVFYSYHFRESNIVMVYILGVLFISLVTSEKIYSLGSSLVSVLIFSFFFTDPRFTFGASEKGYPVTFTVMLAAAFITSSLVLQLKRYTRQAVQNSYRTRVLLETNQKLQSCADTAQIAKTTAAQLMRLLDRDVVFYPQEGGKLAAPLIQRTGKGRNQAGLDAEEKEAADWVFHNNRYAGAATDTFSDAKWLYFAVRINDFVYGIVGIAINGGPGLEPSETRIVLSILGESAMALESQAALKAKAEADLLAENEKLRANLLRSISHDLRTPLTSISGNAGILLSSHDTISEDKKVRLYSDIYEDSVWLINLVENLLSVTRIEDGTMTLNTQTELIDEVIDEALHHIDRHKHSHKILVKRSEDFILARMDVRLIVQVIVNLVDNAIKYTPAGSEIHIAAEKKEGWVIVRVADNGEGLNDEAKKRVFDMFYTAGTGAADSRRSLGLGLALCKSIVNAHGGQISVYDNKPKGAVFQFTLPAEEVKLHE